jgi:16S rRNA (guanine527-N7)-methyltransferase
VTPQTPEAAGLDVSRETLKRLVTYKNLLAHWQGRMNLVGPTALDQFWTRHVSDSGQVLELAPPDALVWADIGSGAGFPGAVIAILLAEKGKAEVHLIESNQRKAAFLRAVSRETQAPLVVHCQRAEEALLELENVHVITSRATASLRQLISWAEKSLSRGAVGLFLKGENVGRELTELGPLSNLSITLQPSRTHPAASIAVVRRKSLGSASTGDIAL